jgi:Phage integrase, N-terminal SAM-like domain
VSGSVRPSGHLQVVDPGSGRRWHALWRDAEGRHQKILGPAWVKDNGKRTARGAIVWRAANGPKPGPSHLTPAEAADRLRMILAGAPRETAASGRRRGPAFGTVAWEWLEHGERKRGLKQSTLKDYRYLIRNHLLPAFGERPLRAITQREIERWQARYERTRTAGQALMVLGAILRYAQRRELIPANPIDGVERHPVRYSGDYDMYSREEIDAIVRGPGRRHHPHRRAHRPQTRRTARPALARHRLPRPGHPRQRQPLIRPHHHPEVRQGPRGAHGRRSRPSARTARRPRAADRRR